jgi:hypothetical protein
MYQTHAHTHMHTHIHIQNANCQDGLDELGLEDKEITGLLGRMCRVRSFWRLEHAVATSHFGGTSTSRVPIPAHAEANPHIFGRMQLDYHEPSLALGDDSESATDSSLACVATHPLTCFMADSISRLVVNLHYRTVSCASRCVHLCICTYV